MTQPLTIDIDGHRISAFHGDRLLDAALLGGIAVPNKCSSGRCGACTVRLLSGDLRGGAAQEPGCFRACQAIVHSSLALTWQSAPASQPEPRPEPAPRQAHAVVLAVADLTHNVTEVTLGVAPATPFSWAPGQFARVTFAGYPTRPFSPTVALQGPNRPNTIRLHVQRLEGGRVSSELGRSIRQGHRVMLEGPFGRATLQPHSAEPLVLFSSGTGFAPIWAIADSALRENAARSIAVVAAVDTLESLYMAEALERMSACANVVIIPVTATPQRYTPLIRTGTVIDFAALIVPNQRVYAAGPPAAVRTLADRARQVGAAFHAIPYEPSESPEDRWLGQIARQFAAQSPIHTGLAPGAQTSAGQAAGRR